MATRGLESRMLTKVASESSVDLVKDSIGQVMAVSFPRSRSAGYAAAVNIAQHAEKYSEADMGGVLFHYAAFGRSREQVALALSVTRYLEGIKAVQFYAGGKLILERLRIDSVLTCFLEACACTDHLAHCNRVVASPFSGVISDNDVVDLDLAGVASGYVFPCAFLLQWGGPGLQRGHPATPEDQIQALAVRRGCDWCPNFKPGDFKKL